MATSKKTPPGVKSVKDLAGHVHQLVEPPIGEGGQGRVYRTENPEVLVKFVCRDGVRVEGESQYQAYRQQFERILELDLGGLQVAAPETVLESPYCGYSMRLLRDMEPIGKLIVPGKDLVEEYRSSGGLRRRLAVLTNLARVVAQLHALPAAYGDFSPNNVWISIKQQRATAWLIDADNLHLICDDASAVFTPGYVAPELAQKGRTSTGSDSFGFACLAFQILCQHEAFNRESKSLPKGGGWSCSQTNSQTADAGEEWLFGGVPWVHDDVKPLDEVPGFPWELVCSSSLRQLFSQTFGAGRLDRTKRPSMARWVEALQQAGDALTTCPGCGWFYFINQEVCPVTRPKEVEIEVNCPACSADSMLVYQGKSNRQRPFLVCRKCQEQRNWSGLKKREQELIKAEGDFLPSYTDLSDGHGCQTPRPGYLYWEIRRWDPDLDEGANDPGTGNRLIQEMRETLRGLEGEDRSQTPSQPHRLGFIVTNPAGSETSVLLTRHCSATRLAQPDHEEIDIEIRGERVFLTRRDTGGIRFHVTRPGEHTKMLTAKRDLPLPEADESRWYLHCGDMNTPHRVLVPMWFPPAGKSGP